MLFNKHARAAIALSLFGLSVAALAADQLPPPGLYRVDTDGTTIHRDGSRVDLQQQAERSATMRMQAPGKTGVTRAISGAPARQLCLGAPAAGGVSPLAGLVGKSNCKSAPPAAGYSFAGRCDTADFSAAVRQLDASTWELKVKLDEHLGAKGMLDFEQQKKMWQITLNNATTAEEKAEAQYTLSHWEEYMADMREAAAESGAAGAPGAATRSTTMTSRLTRVADSCTLAKR